MTDKEKCPLCNADCCLSTDYKGWICKNCMIEFLCNDNAWYDYYSGVEICGVG